jgi:hypothetical protein
MGKLKAQVNEQKTYGSTRPKYAQMSLGLRAPPQSFGLAIRTRPRRCLAPGSGA